MSPWRHVIASTMISATIVSVRAQTQGPAVGGSAKEVEEPYVVRGRQAEVKQRAFKERLERFHAMLVETLRRDAPDVLATLQPPPPLEYGYQILPRIIPDAPPKPPARPQVVSYSWRWSETLIAQEMKTLDRLETDLAAIPVMTGSTREAAYEAVVVDYKKVIDHRRLIDSDFDYNWLWQAAIARDRASFDRITKILDAAVALQARSEPLTPDLYAGLGAVSPLALVRNEHVSDHMWQIIVPFVTDIQDATVVGAFKTAIEDAWQARIGSDEFRVRLDIEVIPPEVLYCESNIPVVADYAQQPPVCTPPPKGAKIDLAAHVQRFPRNRSGLTTGAASLRIVAGPTLVLSPHDVTPHVLAHEFGHMLGLPDAYFRGYRDLGIDGFQILELVPDPADIMASSGTGRVLARHFEVLIRANDVARLMQAGLDAFYRRSDVAEAAARFRELLERSPGHYGATFQLAKVLDRSGKTAEALGLWKKVLAMAEAIQDAETAGIARTRLAGAGDAILR